MKKYSAIIEGEEVDLQEMVLEYIDSLLHHMKSDLTQIRENWSELSMSPHTAFSLTIDYVDNVRSTIRFENEECQKPKKPKL